MTTSVQYESSDDYGDVSILIEASNRDFYQPNLDRFQPPDFPRLSGTDMLIDRVQRHRLMLIAGEPALDPLSVVRYLAWFLSTQINRTNQSHRGIRVLEWQGGAGQFIDQAIEQFQEPTLFILPRLQPHHTGHNLGRLIRALGSCHYAIGALENYAVWHHSIPETARQRHVERLEDGQVFNGTDLVKFLADRLRILVPAALQRTRGRIHVINRPLGQLAVQLRNFAACEEFARLLSEEARRQAITPTVIERCIQLATDDTIRLQEWYLNLPTMRAQLLAVALSLFDGLGESQFFAAVDQLMVRAWRKRDPGLCAIDYCDLDAVEAFFQTTPASNADEMVFAPRLPDQRRRLLEVLWNRHRRAVISALPVLVAYVEESIDNREGDLDLYGGAAKREQLRKALSGALSDISALDMGVAQNYLLQLAMARNIGVQAVAANALARWRLLGRHHQLVSLLRRWLDDSEVRRTIERIQGTTAQSTTRDAQSAVKQTVVLTIGYAAQSDRPNLIYPDLFALLEQLARDTDPAVLQALASYTIPMLLTQHLKQVEELVIELTQQVDLHRTIATSVVQAYRKQAVLIAPVLEHWLSIHLEPLVQARGKRAQARVSSLTCLCTIYGMLPYSEVPYALSPRDMITSMQKVLRQEQHPTVRQAALAAIIGQSRDYFAVFQDIVPGLQEPEQEKIVEKLVDVYREQRRQQSGGDTVVTVGGQRYAVWIGALPPPTTIELEMNVWVKSAQNPIAQQIGVRAQIGFLGLELEIERRAQALAQSRRRQPRGRMRPSSQGQWPRNGLYLQDFYLYWIVPWLVALWVRRYREIIRGLLPELVAQTTNDEALTSELLGKWETFITDATIIQVSRRGRRALFLASPTGRRLVVWATALALLAAVGLLTWALFAARAG